MVSLNDMETSGRSPLRSTRGLWLLCLIGALAIFVPSAVGLERIQTGYAISSAELDAVRVSRGIVASQADQLLSMGAQRHLVLDPSDEDTARLHAALRGFSSSYDILKVKLYSPDCRIVYSSDPAIVGIVDAENERLARALLGTISSDLESSDAMVDLREETHFSVEVVETYVPIYNVQAEVVGVFEMYQDFAPYRAAARARYYRSVALIGAVAGLAAVLAFVVLRRRESGFSAEYATALHAAGVDPPTGLNTSAAAYARAVQECNRMKRRRQGALEPSLAILLVEIDGLEELIQRSGRTSADQVLLEVGRRLVESVRSYDIVGWSGPRRFMVVLPETSLSDAPALAERLRLAVASTPIEAAPPGAPTTVSLGAAITFGPTPSVDVVLRRAEIALQEAQDGGGNRAIYLSGGEESSARDTPPPM